MLSADTHTHPGWFGPRLNARADLWQAVPSLGLSRGCQAGSVLLLASSFVILRAHVRDGLVQCGDALLLGIEQLGVKGLHAALLLQQHPLNSTVRVTCLGDRNVPHGSL